MPHTYQVKVNWIEARRGMLTSDVLDSTIPVVTPPEFPNGIAGQWSPEHLFVAAIIGCFMTTFLAIAENSGLAFARFECDAMGILGKVDGKFKMTHVTLYPVVSIHQEHQREKAIRVLEMSEKACLISNSVNSEIILRPMVSVVYLP